MRMKTRLTALLLTAVLAFAFTACGKKTPAAPGETVVLTDAAGETVTDEQGQPVTETVPAAQTEPSYSTVTDEAGEAITDAAGAPVTVPAEIPADEDDAPPPEDAPIEDPDGDVVTPLPPAEPETPVEQFNNALLEYFTDEQKSDQWFSAYGMDDGSGGVSAALSMAQSSDSTDEAFRLAVSWYAQTKAAAEAAGLKLSAYEFTVLHGGATVGMYTTSDGANYTAIESGVTSQKTA